MLRLSGSFGRLAPLLLVHSAVIGAPLVLQCPARYPEPEHLKKMLASGWRAPVDGTVNAPLDQAGALTGSTAENAELRGSEFPNGTGSRFDFLGTAEDGEKWVFCSYAAQLGRVRLFHAVPLAAKRCEAHVKKSRDRVVAATIRCD